MSSRAVAASRFQKLDAIASGAFGVVYRARDRRTGETVAMKCLRTNHHHADSSQIAAAFAREVAALEACRGDRHIVQPRGSGRVDDDAAGESELFLAMEFVGPTLKHAMKRGHCNKVHRHSELQVRLCMRQLLRGAAGMHRRGMMHRDLKPENVLVDCRTGALKICDLGLSCGTAHDDKPHSSRVGTAGYRAPELLLGATDYDERVDAWALGCIMGELLAGERIFLGRSDYDQLDEIVSTIGTKDIKEWSGYVGQRLPGGGIPHSCLRYLFPSCPAKAKIDDKPLLSEAGFEVLSGLLRGNPDKRMTAERALHHRWFKGHNPALPCEDLKSRTSGALH